MVKGAQTQSQFRESNKVSEGSLRLDRGGAGLFDIGGWNAPVYKYGWFSVPECHPYFTPISNPQFFERTTTEYASTPLYSSGIKRNEWLDALVRKMPAGTYIAGGFMRSLIAGDDKFDDVDLFFNSGSSFSVMVDLIANDEEHYFAGYKVNRDMSKFWGETRKYRLLNFTPPPDKDKPKLQLIKLAWFDSPEAVIDGFDLTCCQFATDGKDLYFNPQAMNDVKEKRLRLHKTNSSLTTLERLIKYGNRGYTADKGEFNVVAERAAELLLGANTEVNKNYFYFRDDNELPIHRSFLSLAFNYLAETEKGREVYARILAGKNNE